MPTSEAPDVRSLSGPAAARQLRAALRRHLGVATVPSASHFDAMSACLVDFPTKTRRILRVACDTPRATNALVY